MGLAFDQKKFDIIKNSKLGSLSTVVVVFLL